MPNQDPERRLRVLERGLAVPMISAGIGYLRMAREIFAGLKHPHTTERIKLAISSAYGARRIEEARRGCDRERKPPPVNVGKAVISRIAWREHRALRRIRELCYSTNHGDNPNNEPSPYDVLDEILDETKGVIGDED